MSSRCDVIIPVKDAVWWVEKCLQELFRCTDPALLDKVLVVNDRSSRESSVALEEVCSGFQTVELLQNQGRPGFVGACNCAAARSRAPYLLFLNTDCLLTPRAIEKLLLACEQDTSIGLACPFSNNSPVLTLPMIPGRSYLEMNELLERINQDRAPSEVVFDACTVVGNCLLITRKCWEVIGGFAEGWGMGYGEETDFQFRAMALGFRGVVLSNTYVFHFGSASFRYQMDFTELQKRNLELFHSKWGSEFVEYQERCSKRDPVRITEERLKDAGREPIAADVLFVLPGIGQTVGGVHVVVEICNYLLRHGLNAKCLVLGELSRAALQSYAEPILFGLLNHSDEVSFLADDSLNAKLVVATLFSTAAPAYRFARMRGVPLVNFVQGYEFLFDNGSVRDRVEQAYWLPDSVIVTSSWLEAGVRRRTPEKPVSVLPIGTDQYLFVPPTEIAGRGKLRLALVLRSAPDKGQAILLEVLDQLLPFRDEISLTVFASDHPVPREWFQSKDTELVRLPTDKGTIARQLRGCDVLVDASLHEGFGLMSLEAMSCGVAVIASDSGGITDFLEDGQNGLLVKEVNKAERFVAEVLKLVHDRQLLNTLRREALHTARRFSAGTCYQRYAEYFKRHLEETGEWKSESPVVSWAGGDEGMRVIGDLLPSKEGFWILEAKHRRPSLTIPRYTLPTGTIPVLKLEIWSSAPQSLAVYHLSTVSWIAGPPHVDLLTYVSSASRLVRGLGNDWSGSIRGVLSKLPRLGTRVEGSHVRVEKGWNELLIECPLEARGNALRLVFERKSESVLRSLQIRGVGDSPAPLNERFEASDAIGWELERGTRPSVLASGIDLLPCLAGQFRSFGDDPGLILPEVHWPSDGIIIGWIDFSVPADTTAQLFYLSSLMTNYSEEGSIRRPAKRGRNIFSVNLPMNLKGRLRFDPGDVRGDYWIHSVRLYSRRPAANVDTFIAESA